MRVRNISSKVVGLKEIVLLPDTEEVLPVELEGTAAVEALVHAGVLTVSGESLKPKEPTEEEKAALKEQEEKAAAEAAAALRESRLAALDGMSEEDLMQLADELGVNASAAKSTADLKKKVKAALNKA